MKKDTEWLKSWDQANVSPENIHKHLGIIRQIQQDAWKQGMTDAIESIRNSEAYAGEHWHIKTIKDAIQKGLKE